MLKIHFWEKFWYDQMVMNYWISAYTSKNVLDVFQNFFDGCSRREPWKENESAVIIAIWMNDCSIEKDAKLQRVWIEDFRKNIESIILKCREDALITKVIFVWNINVDEEAINSGDDCENYFYNSEVIKYNATIKELAAKNNFWYIDVFWLMNNEDLEDWLHPNTVWHTKIFEKVRNYLED